MSEAKAGSESLLPKRRSVGMRVQPLDLDDALETCAEEPIQMPGSIQPHGFLLGLDNTQETVVFASESAADFLGVPLKLLLGASLDQFLERELLASIRMRSCALEPEGLVSFLGSFRVADDLFSVVTHCTAGQRLLEFERQDRLVGPEMMNAVITNFVGILSNVETEAELCKAVTQQVFELTGFDRVLLYSFDDEGHGTVLTEANNGKLPSYLGLRFPSSDVPAQARALYLANTVRIIPDASYTPSPILASSGEVVRAVDLSLSILRSVSPVHLEYMRNMGTLSSMSVSIVCEGKLWGLISAHNSQPMTVPFLSRSACDMLARMAATQLHSFRAVARLETLVRFHEVQRGVLTAIASENNYLAALSPLLPALLGVTDADGVALALDNEVETLGKTPELGTIRRLAGWLAELPGMELYSSYQLGQELPWAAPAAATASGLLAIRISDLRPRFVLWFRQEVVETVTWAGEPVKQVDAQQHLHPRSSFDQWRETVHGQSRRWSEAELDSAREFRSALNTISLKRAEEEAELSAARFERLTHVLPIQIFAVNDAGELTYVNERWREKGLGARGVWWQDRVAPEDLQRCAQAWERAVASGTEFEEELRLVPRGTAGAARLGEPWNLIRLVPFRRAGAERAGWIGACIDLTERRQREQALRVTEKLALTGRMTSFLAHEINNPLESMTNLLYLLRQRMLGDREAVSFFDMVDVEMDRISGTVKQTLRWGDENSGKPSWSSSRAIFDDAVRLFSAKVRNRSVEVVRADAEDVPVFGIMSQVRQVVAHLFSNALDATPVGGQVTLRVEMDGPTTLRLCVEDAGVGMAPEELGKLFQPFYSTKGDYGNGLGLYISMEIAERHHGTIEIASEPGRGTRACLVLPAGSAWEPEIAAVALG